MQDIGGAAFTVGLDASVCKRSFCTLFARDSILSFPSIYLIVVAKHFIQTNSLSRGLDLGLMERLFRKAHFPLVQASAFVLAAWK
jgi:hypothetical protein